MLLGEHAKTPGEHQLILSKDGQNIEVMVSIPEAVNWNYVALLGHPHSLQGGTMNNKVVTTMARVFKDLNVPSIRFNFRGVGQSMGQYDSGIGESEDMLWLANNWQQTYPHANIIFAGFSFGSYVAYRAATHKPHQLLITIAPPVHHYNYQESTLMPNPWVILQGDDDDVVPLQFILDFVAQTSPPQTLLRFAKTGHFFHGKLVELKSRLIETIKSQIAL